MVLALLVLSAGMLCALATDFIIGALSDERVTIAFEAAPAAFLTAPLTDNRLGINPDVLTAATTYLPNSSRLHLRLAQFEAPYGREDWKSAEFHARRAVQLSPHDYKPLVALASVE